MDNFFCCYIAWIPHQHLDVTQVKPVSFEVVTINKARYSANICAALRKAFQIPGHASGDAHKRGKLWSDYIQACRRSFSFAWVWFTFADVRFTFADVRFAFAEVRFAFAEARFTFADVRLALRDAFWDGVACVGDERKLVISALPECVSASPQTVSASP